MTRARGALGARRARLRASTHSVFSLFLNARASYGAIYGNQLLVVAHNFRHKSYDASYRSTTNNSVTREMQVMVQVMDFIVSRLKT